MDQMKNGLSREMIIHPGETLKEILEDRGMSQLELSQRTGVTAKHISTIINGEKNISVSFAKKLEYALGIEATFWINLQTNYDKELIEYEELNSISKEEIAIVKLLKKPITWFEEHSFLEKLTNIPAKIVELRKLLGVSNLTLIKTLTYNAAFRAQKCISASPEVIFAWQKICELSTKKIEAASLSEEEQNIKLKHSLPQIKACMFLEPKQFIKRLMELFAKCGISFSIVPSFTGAPVQGFIKKTEQEKTILCMTFRAKKADIFWFTLFHEIGHILNGDGKQKFIDFESVENAAEIKADTFAQNTLIDKKEYQSFVNQNNFSLEKITNFAKTQKVLPCVVIGRLQKEEKIKWSEFNDQMIMYEDIA